MLGIKYQELGLDAGQLGPSKTDGRNSFQGPKEHASTRRLYLLNFIYFIIFFKAIFIVKHKQFLNFDNSIHDLEQRFMDIIINLNFKYFKR